MGYQGQSGLQQPTFQHILLSLSLAEEYITETQETEINLLMVPLWHIGFLFFL